MFYASVEISPQRVRNLPSEEPIDLLNVAFENPRKIQIREEKVNGKKKRVPTQDDCQNGFDPYDVPDRITGLEEIKELRRLCPQRRWNFVSLVFPQEILNFYLPSHS